MTGRKRSDWPFITGLALLGGAYLLLIAAMLAADLSRASGPELVAALRSPEVRSSVRLSLASSSIAAILSLWVAVPLGYLLSRFEFPGRAAAGFLIDVPIVLPPLVVGLSLLILMQTTPGRAFQQRAFPVTYGVPAVILAQFAVAAAFAVRAMEATFTQIDPRPERVALTLGCTRGEAFWRVALPQARRGVVRAGTLAWARSFGEFGPILVFAGATRMKTEVLPTTVFLELSVGRIESALAVSLLMVLVAAASLAVMRAAGPP